MPLYIDIHHNLIGLTPETLAVDHRRDLAVQDQYGVRCLKYWYAAATGTLFCLSWAPSQEAALAVHGAAQRTPADDIFEVQEGG